MARLSDAEKQRKMEVAKVLYLDGQSAATICRLVDVRPETLNDWIVKNDWERAKKLQHITPSNIREMILNTAIAIDEGKKPKVSPDQIAKLASALEKLNINEANLGYMIEAFQKFNAAVVSYIATIKNEEKRNQLFAAFQQFTEVQETLVRNLSKSIFPS